MKREETNQTANKYHKRSESKTKMTTITPALPADSPSIIPPPERVDHSLGNESENTNIYSNRTLATTYSSVRTIYTDEYFSHIIEYYRKANERVPKLCVDVATGHGQVAIPLCSKLLLEDSNSQVIGFDKNEAVETISEELRNNLHFKLGPAEKLLEIVGGEERKEGFLDLVTVAQAFHWFEEDVFLGQAIRGLRSGGVLSISVYGPKMHFTDNTEASDLLYGCWSRLKSWADWGTWFESHYATLEGRLLDFHNQQSNLGGEFCDVKRHQLKVSRSLTWNQIVSFVKSWAILNIYKHANPQAIDPSIEALEKLKPILCPENDDVQQFVIEWELSLILARKK